MVGPVSSGIQSPTGWAGLFQQTRLFATTTEIARCDFHYPVALLNGDLGDSGEKLSSRAGFGIS